MGRYQGRQKVNFKEWEGIKKDRKVKFKEWDDITEDRLMTSRTWKVSIMKER